MQDDLPIDARFAPIDFREELNDEQFAAVTAPPGPALVLAGAGSGKTRTLTYRVAYLLSQGIQPWEIMLLTFTNKAAKEMLGRVQDLTGVAGHKLWGGTFHSIGQRMLRIHGTSVALQPSYTILDEGDSEGVLTDAIRSVDAGFLKSKNNPKAKVLKDMISYARNTMEPVAGVVADRYPFFENIGEKVETFHHAYQKRKLEQQVVDYDDLLELWLKLLQQDKEVASKYQERFKHILVDEYQDTNRLQSAIVDMLGAHHQVMAVGDDAQCIYTWRGADFENIMTFPDRHEGTIIHKIETNYRSSPEILNLANSVLQAQPAGFGYSKELHAVRRSHQLPILAPVMDTRQQAQFICARIRHCYDQGASLKDIAVLYRAHFHAMDLQMELSRQQIPYVITSGVRFFEQAHVKDVAAQLRFVHNPRDLSAWHRFVCLLPKIGPRSSEKIYLAAREVAEKNRQDFFNVLQSDPVMKKVPAPAKDTWEQLALSLKDLWTANQGSRPSEVVRLAIEGWYTLYLRQNYPNWPQRQEDLESLVGFAGRYETMEELLAQLVLLSSETSDRSVEPSEDSIRLTTVHQAKGLEFPIVFVIGLADGLFPLRRAIEADDTEEERRLFYVALTRAMDELYMTYPMITTGNGPPQRNQPSRFLQEIPQDRYETVRMRQMHSGW